MSELSPQPGSPNPRPLEHWLGTAALANLSMIDRAAILAGQREPSRESKRQRYSSTRFYGDAPMGAGLMGHSHAQAEIATVLEGQLSFGIDRTLYQAQTGDWLVLRSGVLHGECCLASHATYWLLWFTFRPERLGIHLTRYSRQHGYEVIDHHRLTPPPAREQAIFDRLASKPWTPIGDVRRDLVRVVWTALDTLPAAPLPRRKPHPLVHEAQTILLKLLHRPPTVVALAEQVGLSPNYLSNLFHQQTGQTIRRFVEVHRIEQAKRILINSDQPIKAIAYQLGFADPHHFSHVFRRITGMSPSEYRRNSDET